MLSPGQYDLITMLVARVGVCQDMCVGGCYNLSILLELAFIRKGRFR